ncbi:hypothetical protein BJY52DRAFT_1195541 [Lactarius psammicola]|nr:hypothetical protein BJY52DRAFT_1195541 [Lactarius psammicola]
MTQVFAAINHRLSEEYTKIDLPTLEAKERCARFPALPSTLFAHEHRIKGMLSRGTTAPPVSSLASPPPLQEKPGGFKQVVAPLSPPPLPAQGEAPIAPPVNGASSSSSLVPVSTSATEEPREPVAETPNGDVPVGLEHHADVLEPADIDGTLQGDGETAECPAPTPEKDEVARGSRTPASVPTVEGASEAT